MIHTFATQTSNPIFIKKGERYMYQTISSGRSSSRFFEDRECSTVSTDALLSFEVTSGVEVGYSVNVKIWVEV